MNIRDTWITDGELWHRPGNPSTDKYDYIELRVRPVSDGLHESNFRFLALTGLWREYGEVKRQDLHQWADHAVFSGPVSIDAEPDGTIRIRLWAGGNIEMEDDFLGSSAMFRSTDPDRAIGMIQATRSRRD